MDILIGLGIWADVVEDVGCSLCVAVGLGVG